MGGDQVIKSLFDSIVSEDRLVSEGYEKGYKAGQKEVTVSSCSTELTSSP